MLKLDNELVIAKESIPVHVGIIMDGNGRWATQRGISRSEGHLAGTRNIERVIRAFSAYGVKYLTIYAFSTENWNRPVEEVSALMMIVREMIDNELERLHQLGVKIRHIGALDGLDISLQDAFKRSIELTKRNDLITLNVAFNYGSRTEILDALKRMIEDGIDVSNIDENAFSSYLDTVGIPDPDLIVRSAGEMRLSNFLLWQAAYSEFYSTSVYWPDFDEFEVRKAIESYGMRKRKFGRLDNEDE